MTQFYTKVKLYLEANSKTWEAEQDKIKLQDDGNGVFIRTWNVNGLAKPTDEQIASYETAANTAETAQGVLSKRAREYPTWQDQMDMQYKDLLNGTTTWKDAVAKVKSDNPKE